MQVKTGTYKIKRTQILTNWWKINKKIILYQKLQQKVLGKMFKWKNKSFPILLMSQYQFQYQLPGQLVSTRIWIRPVVLLVAMTFDRFYGVVMRHNSASFIAAIKTKIVVGSIDIWICIQLFIILSMTMKVGNTHHIKR